MSTVIHVVIQIIQLNLVLQLKTSFFRTLMASYCMYITYSKKFDSLRVHCSPYKQAYTYTVYHSMHCSITDSVSVYQKF